jgi:hypothetical protein
MDVSKAVSEFVKSGRDLFWLLRSEGKDVTPLDLHLLLTELFILQVEARSLKSALQNTNTSARFPHQVENDHLPSITPMSASLQVGTRLQAMRNHYPACLGAIGRIQCFKGMPGNWYAVVEWEQPFLNFSDEKMTNLWPISLTHFEVLPEAS